MTSPRFKRLAYPFHIYQVQLREAADDELQAISELMGLGLNLAEMKACQAYFRREGREPRDAELQTIAQTWSEHCFHKTFKGDIVDRDGKLIARGLLRTYIAAVTRELNPPWCLSVFEDNAGIVDFGEGYAIAAKVETHNHPSAIEPFGGAATGVGGVIRDILGVWAEPIANMDVLCFGPLGLDPKRLPTGVKHPSYLFRGVVAGVGSYGNNMGIPTVNGAIYFHDGYVGNVVVYCGCVGLLPSHAYVKDVKAGDIAVLVGGRTGRDGIHGVTFASADLTEESEEVYRPAVQIPNPFEEEKVARALMTIRDLKLGSSVTDLGGGGLSSAVGETANRAGLGVEVQLDKVPLRYGGMAPWEIWVSESQERMLVTARERSLPDLLAVFSEEDVEATPIGRFVEDRSLRVTFHDVPVVDLDLGFLFEPPRVTRVADWAPTPTGDPELTEPEDLRDVLFRMLSLPNVCSREGVVRTYDHEVRGNTVIKPLQGVRSGPNDAAVL
ncbi:MAG: AIR synthase-related protein, partial [Candidatus Bathyarchaeia archaeon]